MDNFIKIILIVIVFLMLFGCSISCKKVEKFTKQVSCGRHRANSCSKCPFNGETHKGQNWCNGDCYWKDDKSVDSEQAEDKNEQPGCLLKKISCGGHRANSCSKCPFSGNKYKGQNWCNGDCYWSDWKKVNREQAEKNKEQPGCLLKENLLSSEERAKMIPDAAQYNRDLENDLWHPAGFEVHGR